MSGVATAIGVGTTLYSGYQQGKAADAAADASMRAAGMSAAAQEKALEYQKQVDKLPLKYRDEALTGLRDVYMGQGQGEMIDKAMNSPLYQALMGGMKTGQEAVLQNAAMQGNWRSGDAKMNMMDYTTRTGQNALLASYDDLLSGMRSFTNPDLNTSGIANTTAGIGATQAAGVTGAAQAQQMGEQSKWDAITGAVNTGLNAYDTYRSSQPATPPPASIPYMSDEEYLRSDIRLKENIVKVGEMNGFNIYEWSWNDIAKKHYGLEGKSRGVMAHEVYETNPDAIKIDDGILTVNYAKLGVH